MSTVDRAEYPKACVTFFVEDAIKYVFGLNQLFFEFERSDCLKDLLEFVPPSLRFETIHKEALQLAYSKFSYVIKLESKNAWDVVQACGVAERSRTMFDIVLFVASRLSPDRFDRLFLFIATVGDLCMLCWNNDQSHLHLPVIEATQHCIMQIMPGQLMSLFIRLTHFATLFLKENGPGFSGFLTNHA